MTRSVVIVLWLAVTCSFATLYQLKVLTDNTPDVNDVVSYVKSVTGPWTDPERKCIMSWKWHAGLRHQTTSASENGTVVKDIIRSFNNYGARVCGTTSEELMLVWKGMGFPAQRRGFSGHTVAEVQYNGTWHMYDAAFGFYFRDKITGEVMSLDAMRLDLAMANFTDPVTTFEGMQGWAIYEPNRSNSGEMLEFTAAPSNSQTYAGTGYSYRLNMRPFESYKRTWLEYGDNSDYYTPYLGEAVDPNDGYLAPFVRTNGEWILSPDFSTDAYKGCVLAESHTALSPSPRLHPDSAGVTAYVDFKVDAANVITSAAISGTVMRAGTNDTVRVLVSTDNGASFQEVWSHSGTGEAPISAAIRAALNYKYSYIVRVEMKAQSDPFSAGLNTLVIRTITQLNQRGLPALTLGSNRVMLKLGAQSAGAKFQPVEVTYQWKEFRSTGTVTRTHVELVSDSVGPHEYYINTAGWRNPDMQYVCVNFQGYNPLGAAVSHGYSDGEDVGNVFERPRVFVSDGVRDLLYHKGYSAFPAASNDPSRTRLTDGATDYNRKEAFALGVQWPAGANPAITFDLDSVKALGGVRVLQTVGADQAGWADSIIVLTSPDSVVFTRQGAVLAEEVWNPPVNYLIPARWDSKDNRRYKNWGIFIHQFRLAFDSAVQCRFVRMEVYNSASCAIMEVEARDTAMKKIPVVDELNNGFTLPSLIAVESHSANIPAVTCADLVVTPNPVTAILRVHLSGARTPFQLSITDINGRVVKRLPSRDQVDWDCKAVSPGLYLVRFQAGNQKIVRKILLLR